MLESRWGRRAGPALATLGALLLATTALGAPGVEDRPPPICRTPPAQGAPAGTWYALEPVLERGALSGHRLRLGAADGASWTIGLPPEAWASGPVGGQVLFGSDDGRTSVVRVFDGVLGCMAILATTTDIVRSALLDPAGGPIHEHRLARADRGELGIWQRGRDAGPAVPVLAPLPTDDRFGPTWRTDLGWSDDGSALAVATCGELACRHRVLDRAGHVQAIVAPDLGALVGLVQGRLVVRGACRGLPCPLLAVDPATGARTILDAEAGSAGLVGGATGRVVVAGVAGDEAAGLRSIDVRTGRGTRMDGAEPPIPPGVGYGAELPDGWFLVASPGDHRASPLARSHDHPARSLHEVAP